jgi:hypothetical protein
MRRYPVPQARVAIAVTVLVLLCLPAVSRQRVTVQCSINGVEDYGSRIVPFYPEMNLSLWYAWINVNETRVLFFAPFSTTFPSPIMLLLAQDYIAPDGIETFAGHSFFIFEVFNDSNGNGVLDVDTSTSPIASEIKYQLLVNCSQGFEWTSVAKHSVNGVDHYNWSITYEGVQGLLLFPEYQPITNVSTNVAADAFIERLGFSYDFSLQGNVSSLKSSYLIGNTTIAPHPLVVGPCSASIANMSLSIVHNLAVARAAGFRIRVNSEIYDSRLASAIQKLTNESEVLSGSARIYELLHRANYTLATSFGNLEIPLLTAACPSSSVTGIQPGWRMSIELMQSFLDTIGRQMGVPAGFNMLPETSPLLYRLCYPQWSGDTIIHDPLYRAFLGKSLPLFIVLSVTVLGTVLLALAVFSLRRSRRKIRAFRTAAREYESETDKTNTAS